MTKLPNYRKAFIDPVKIGDYILSSSHPVGRFKAEVFKRIGYTQDDWKELLEDIKKYHLTLDARPVVKTAYGQKT